MIIFFVGYLNEIYFNIMASLVLIKITCVSFMNQKNGLKRFYGDGFLGLPCFL